MSEQYQYLHINSPVGKLELEATSQKLTAVRFHDFKAPNPVQSSENEILNTTKKQIDEYFNDDRIKFDMSLRLSGTEFEKKVWEQLQTISYGSTITYSELAKKLGDKNKVRAVGRANGNNPLPIVIPCHRVIGANNRLVGYGGGIENKRKLLQHERGLLL